MRPESVYLSRDSSQPRNAVAYGTHTQVALPPISNVVDFRSQIALRQMVRDQQVDADVARDDRRKDWGLRIDAEILRAEIRFGTRTHREVAAEFARRGMRIETALRLLSPMRVAA